MFPRGPPVPRSPFGVITRRARNSKQVEGYGVSVLPRLQCVDQIKSVTDKIILRVKPVERIKRRVVLEAHIDRLCRQIGNQQ